MKERRCLKCGGRRPKAFWGALIGAAASLIGTGLSISAQSRAQKEALAEQRRLQQEQEREALAESTTNSLNNYFNTLKNEPEEEFEFKKGGRLRLRNAPHVTDGGPLLNLSTGRVVYPGEPMTYGKYLDMGYNHEEKNPQGGHGTGYIQNGKPFETERGEVIDNRPNEIMVFSKRAKKDGKSFAQRALEGENENDLMQEQLARNSKRHLASRPKAKLGAKFGTADYIGLGVNTLGSVLSGLWASSAYNDLAKDINYYVPEFYAEHAVAGPTTYHNSAQIGNVKRNQLGARRSIARNTASSATALDRMQKVDTDAMLQLNELWDTKENKENEMRMKNAEMENELRARNAMARNEYYRNVAQIRNNELAARLGMKQAAINSNVGMIQGIGSSVGNFLQQGIDNYENQQARIAQIASSENGSAKRMASMGYDFTQDELASLYNDALNNYERTGTEADADDVKFWARRINPGYARRHNLATPTRKNVLATGPIV